jgi:DNA-binding PadR family transcriptional regulator
VSTRHSLLALLSGGHMHGYGLKTEFEAATGEVWPLDVGQVYTTLGRMERDGVVSAGAEAEGQKVYEITEAGHEEVSRWFETPVPREVIPRQELAIQLVFAMRSSLADVAAVAQRQREATVRALQDVSRLKAAAESGGDLAWLLMLDALAFQAEAEVRWLDLCEARLARQRLAPRHGPPGPRGPGPATGGAEPLTAVLDLRGVGRVFGSARLRVIALHDVSLRVAAGEFVACRSHSVPSATGRRSAPRWRPSRPACRQASRRSGHCSSWSPTPSSSER